jgi:hypothetical protein
MLSPSGQQTAVFSRSLQLALQLATETPPFDKENYVSYQSQVAWTAGKHRSKSKAAAKIFTAMGDGWRCLPGKNGPKN